MSSENLQPFFSRGPWSARRFGGHYAAKPMAFPQGGRVMTRIIAIAVATVLLASIPAWAQRAVSVADCPPISEKRSEIGCYTLAEQPLGALPERALFWHLDTFGTRRRAEAAKGPRSTVVEAFGQTWLLTIAERGWRAAGGNRVADIGPLPRPAAAQFTAMYLEATFVPGGSVAAHRHSGPEVWYTLSGEQCLETPEGRTIARAGESTIIRGGLPMALLTRGTETRRSVVLILHDSSQPASTFVNDWAPKGLCEK
jgi:quercetin dioxygenase-like cupin family protein